MNKTWTVIEQDGKLILQKIATGEQLVVKYLEAQAQDVAAFFKSELASPEVKTVLAGLLAQGEKALAALAGEGEATVEKDAPEWVAGAETWLANIAQAKAGGVAGDLITTLGDAGLQGLETIGLIVVKAALAKVLAGALPAVAAAV